tara:strand:+ start:113 stop:1024 length:912 start_codon:yes stop_codon:yes gene_type:complete
LSIIHSLSENQKDIKPLFDSYLSAITATNKDVALSIKEQKRNIFFNGFFIHSNNVPKAIINYGISNWDTKFFGMKCSWIDLIDISNDCVVIRDLLELYSEFETKNNIEFSVAKINRNQVKVIDELKIIGYKIIEETTTYYYSSLNQPIANDDRNIRVAEKSDLENLKRIVIQTDNTRFHNDKIFSKKKVDEFRKTWIINLFSDHEKKVYVYTIHDNVVGFVTVESNNKGNKEGVLKLIAVDNKYRGKGIGTSLVKTALKWFNNNCRISFITTQTSNYPSNKMYQKSGCKVAYKLVTLHKNNCF